MLREENVHRCIYILINLNILITKNKQINHNNINENELLYLINNILLQKNTINQLKNNILSLHDNVSKDILNIYNLIIKYENELFYNINNLKGIINKNINDDIKPINNNDILHKINEIINNKNVLNTIELIISHFLDLYIIEIIDNKKILIKKNDNIIYTIKILKTTINLITQDNIEIKNIDYINRYKQVIDDFINYQELIKNSKNFVDYVKNRNTLTYKTTFLSAYIKFGCISLREVYHGFHKNLPADSAFFDELYWHDFYAQAIYHYPKVLEGKSMDERFDKIKWSGTWKDFDKWCQGETGFPIVDAAMKQLNTTGFMHNRARMIVASFLVKTLLCDWRWGEKYFAQKLVDYDPASNVGGWLWTAGGGFDSQPYFRIFNPWTQSEKFDKDAEYIKYWLPESF